MSVTENDLPDNMKILIADDEYLLLDALADMIKEVLPQAQTDKFRDGVHALEAAECKKYDMVITDIGLRQLSGIELAGRIHERYPDTHILFVTGELERVIERMGIQPQRCLYKPFTEKELRNKFDELGTLPPFEIKSAKKNDEADDSLKTRQMTKDSDEKKQKKKENGIYRKVINFLKNHE